jgi:hypothetical protein
MANYLNFTKATFNPYNPKVLNEGQFSWITYDTDKQIGSERENTIDVYMYDNEGNQWYEKGYEGYGEFGKMDYYELLAKMNGYSEEDLIKKYKGKDMRDIGIDLAFNKLKTKAKGGKVLFPALVEDPKFNWKRHDFKQEAESDENQSWYQEEDEDEDDDYEQGWYESLKTNEGAMSEIHIMAKEAKNAEDFKKEFYKEYGTKIKKSSETDEWIKELYTDSTNEAVTEATDEDKPYFDFLVALRDSGATNMFGASPYLQDEFGLSKSEARKILSKWMKSFSESVVTEKPELTWDSLKESLGLNEGRSITKISKDHAQTVLDMSNTAKDWKVAEGDRKTELLELLRELNKRKAELEVELDDAVAGKDRNIQLALEEAEELAYLEIDIKNILEVNGQEN